LLYYECKGNETTLFKITQLTKPFSISLEGYIINDCNFSEITDEWRLLIEDVVKLYQEFLIGSLHSVYIRGSVAHGGCVKNQSDIDTFALIQNDIDKDLFLQLKQSRKKPLSEHPFVKGIEVKVFPYEQVIRQRGGISFTIKTQSICVYGDDISNKILPYGLNYEAVTHTFWLPRDISVAQKDLFNSEDEARIMEICSWIMKRLVRSGFEIYMGDARIYTRDLYQCWEIFSHYEPEYKDAMGQALMWAVYPSNKVDDITEYLDTFGTLLCDIIQIRCKMQ